MNDSEIFEYFGCRPPAASSPGTSTSTQTSSSLQDLKNEMQSTNAPVEAAIDHKAAAETGGQISALQSSEVISKAGANQAATIGAVFCAQGANAQLAGSPDTPGLYAQCQQGFATAMALGAAAGGLSPNTATLAGPQAQQALSKFEKNFGIGRDEYLARMLGPGGGAGALPDLVAGKLAADLVAEKLRTTENVPQAAEGGKSMPTSEVTAGGPKAGRSLRDTLRSKLGQAGDERLEPATPPPAGKRLDGKILDLEPLPGVFAGDNSVQELTLFDIVHLKYSELARRLGR